MNRIHPFNNLHPQSLICSSNPCKYWTTFWLQAWMSTSEPSQLPPSKIYGETQKRLNPTDSTGSLSSNPHFPKFLFEVYCTKLNTPFNPVKHAATAAEKLLEARRNVLPCTAFCWVPTQPVGAEIMRASLQEQAPATIRFQWLYAQIAISNRWKEFHLATLCNCSSILSKCQLRLCRLSRPCPLDHSDVGHYLQRRRLLQHGHHLPTLRLIDYFLCRLAPTISGGHRISWAFDLPSVKLAWFSLCACSCV